MWLTTALPTAKAEISKSQSFGGEENKAESEEFPDLQTKCTPICGDGFTGKSCAKTILVKVFPKGHPQRTFVTYAVLDDQSNASLSNCSIYLGFQGEIFPYSLSSCSGLVSSSRQHQYSQHQGGNSYPRSRPSLATFKRHSLLSTTFGP